VLLWPAAPPDVDLPAETAAFRWDADELFAALEAEFTRAGATELGEATDVLDGLETEGSALLSRVAGSDEPPFDALARLSSLQFELAVQGAAHPSLLPRAENFFVGSRLTLMKAATVWPTDRATHEALYRVLFGGRMALDEALIQAGTDALAPLLHIEDIPSSTPSILVEGVRIHSGDVLLSRGGAPTSALIARGNDFPNTFSHAALLLALGWTVHVAWDVSLHLARQQVVVPAWYPSACISFDLLVAGYVVWTVRRHSSSKKLPNGS
jgi:hypothetical protein